MTPSSPRQLRPRQRPEPEPPLLAEVFRLHTPTEAEPAEVVPEPGDQLALPLFYLFRGGAE